MPAKAGKAAKAAKGAGSSTVPPKVFAVTEILAKELCTTTQPEGEAPTRTKLELRKLISGLCSDFSSGAQLAKGQEDILVRLVTRHSQMPPATPAGAGGAGGAGASTPDTAAAAAAAPAAAAPKPPQRCQWGTSNTGRGDNLHLIDSSTCAAAPSKRARLAMTATARTGVMATAVPTELTRVPTELTRATARAGQTTVMRTDYEPLEMCRCVLTCSFHTIRPNDVHKQMTKTVNHETGRQRQLSPRDAARLSLRSLTTSGSGDLVAAARGRWVASACSAPRASI